MMAKAAKPYNAIKAWEDATRRLVGNYDEWPAWPKLPMKHATRKLMGAALLGTMTEEDSDTYNVYLCTMFERITDEMEVERFKSVDDLIDAGWRVD